MKTLATIITTILILIPATSHANPPRHGYNPYPVYCRVMAGHIAPPICGWHHKRHHVWHYTNGWK